MAKLKVCVAKGFPLYDPVSAVLITPAVVEVEDSDWLQAQIEAGLVLVEDAKPSKAKESKSKA